MFDSVAAGLEAVVYCFAWRIELVSDVNDETNPLVTGADDW